MTKAEYRANIITLLKSKEANDWLLAIMTYKEGGFTVNEAWRWFIYGMFESAGFLRGSTCGDYYYNAWIGANITCVFEFGGVALKLTIVELGTEENPTDEVFNYSLDIAGKVYHQRAQGFDACTVSEYIPNKKPYKDFEGLEGNAQAYFYAILCRFLMPYKQDIIQGLHIDLNYTDPTRVEPKQATRVEVTQKKLF